MNMRLAAVMFLVGCAVTTRQPVVPPPSQPMTMQSYRDLLQDLLTLLTPCPVAEPKKHTTEELVRVANARKDALLNCNVDKLRLKTKIEESVK